jgi:acyl-CoA thioesterase
LNAPAITSEFERATAVRPLGDGLYAGEVDGGWSAPTGPNGGYLAAIATRALQAHVAPSGERQLRSLTCHYLRPAREGAIDFEVETIRAGRRFSTARLTASQDGKQAFTALAAFSTGGLASAGTWSPAMPEAGEPPPREAGRVPFDRYRRDAGAWLRPVETMPPIVQRVKLAPRFGGIPFSGRELAPGEAPETGGWIELPEPRPIDAAYVALLTDVWWPPSFEPLSSLAIAPTIDLTIHVRAELPPEGLPDQPVLGRFHTTASMGGLMEEDGELFLADGTLLAQSRQLALLAPVDRTAS